MDFIENIEIVKDSYNKVVKEEIKFRDLSINPNDVLEDTFQTCFILAMRDTQLKEFQHLQLGIKNFVNFTLVNFHLEQAIIASAKVAYLTEVLKMDKPKLIVPYKNSTQIKKDWLIENPKYNKLNKLKKNNLQAFYYWYQALLIRKND